MPQTIWKFPLVITDSQTIEIPESAQILSCQLQHGTPCMWAIVNPDAMKERRTVFIFGTGNEFQDRPLRKPLVFIDTIQMAGGSLVWHVFMEQSHAL